MKALSSIVGLRTLAFSCFLLMPLVSPAQQASQTGTSSSSDAQLASVAGQVVRVGTNEPLKKARILLTAERDNSADPYITITDAAGQFAIAEIRPGRYKMEVESTGRLPQRIHGPVWLFQYSKRPAWKLPRLRLARR
jgi:hypothetical protein